MSTHKSTDVAERKLTSGTLRISAAWALPDVLHELGIALDDVLADAGLEAGLFGDRENAITYPQLERLFLACERRSACDHFGFLVGQRSRLADMGLAGAVALCQRTAGAGLREFVEFFNLHDTAATVTLIGAGTYVRFVYAVTEHGMTDTRHFQQGGIAIACNILQDLCGPEWMPIGVTFASRRPSNPGVLRKYLHAPVQFDADESAVLFARHWLDEPLRTVEPWKKRAITQQARAQRQQMLADFPATLRRLLRKQLLLGRFSMQEIAAQLSMHRRTLDRHLQKHGVGYGEVLESVKEDVARLLLRDTSMPIQQIAETVRFSSAANFATAFRRRVGMTPSEYRRFGASTAKPDGDRHEEQARQQEDEPGEPRLRERVAGMAISDQE